MKARLLCLLALAPGMLEAQVVLYSLNGIAPSPLGSVYGYGQVAAGDSMIVRFRALNTRNRVRDHHVPERQEHDGRRIFHRQ